MVLENRNIMYVVPSMNSGGVEVGIMEIAKKVNETKDFNMFLLTSGGNLLSRIKRYGVKCIELNVQTKNPIKIFKNIEKIKKILTDNRIDIVQVESRAPAWSCYYACKSLNIPMITVVQFNGVFKKQFFLKKIYNSKIFSGNPIIFVSNAVKDYSINFYKKYIHRKKLKKETVVIHRAIDVELYNKNNISSDRIVMLLNKLKLPDDKLIITVPARFTKQKGQDYFLRVLRRLKSNNYFCLLVGDITKKFSYVKTIEKLIYKYNLEGFVKIQGNVSDMPALYSLSNIVVCPSITPEAFGRIAIETQAMERIFIGMAVGGALETVIDKKTGFLVKKNDEKEFAAVIDMAINLSKSERENIEKQARQNVIDNFTFSKFYDSLLKLYEKTFTSDDFRNRD